jgi:hypothetical protein
MYSYFSAACGEMEDLPDGGITKIVGRQRILWFGNLLRCSPGGDPELRFCARLRYRLLPRKGEDQEKQENRAVFQRVPHIDYRYLVVSAFWWSNHGRDMHESSDSV